MTSLIRKILPVILICFSISLIAQPTAPTSVSASQTTICMGTSITLSYTGGSGDTFEWYSSSCGGDAVGSGDNLLVTPAVTTTYYGRWETATEQSSCESVTVTVIEMPTAPSSLSATLTTLCSGATTILSYSGGLGDTFNWYSGSCGGTLVGTGNNLMVAPTVTTTYYGQWTNACGSSICLSISITVNPSPEPPTSVGASFTSVCEGGSTVLSYSGGSGDNFYWYSGSCGGTYEGSGNNLTVYPTSNTTYYGQWSNSCGTSACLSVSVTVDALPTAPSAVNASETTICEGEYTILSYTGGSGANFNWYSGSCGGDAVGSGNNLYLYPTETTTYYGQWETGCGTSTCASVTVVVNPTAEAPDGVSASQTSICEGTSVTLTYTGGSGDTFYWYADGCGGTPVASGNGISVSPTTTTTYYGRWENTCGESTCETVTVSVDHFPVAPTTVNSSSTSICYGDQITLSSTGGSGTTFNWYTSSCEGAYMGSGETWLATPSSTTTYYGQWETSCGSSTCESVTVEVGHFPELPSSLNATQTDICAGESTTLYYVGGTGEVFTWYTGACGGTAIGTGNNLEVSPTVTTTYYGNWSSNCGTGACLQVTVYVSQYPTRASSVSATRTNICYGESSTLRYTGGSGDTFWWFYNGCEGSIAGTGNNFSVSPSVTTTYYGLWETDCGRTECDTVTIYVESFVDPPSSLNVSDPFICQGDSVLLTYYGGYGDTFYWYSDWCRGTLVGTGNNIWVKPTTYTTYYGAWENSCFQSECLWVTVDVGSYPTPANSVSAIQTSICEGSSTSLTYSGGMGDTFWWYANACGGQTVGTGNYISVYPSYTTTYYGLWETYCGQTECDTVTVEVVPYTEAPYIVSATRTTICQGESTYLTYNGGVGETFVWYENNCRGTRVGEGDSLKVSPTELTTYYGAWENRCYHSDCLYVTVDVETDCEPAGISLPEMAGLMIYPNPTSDQVFITSPDKQYEDIELSVFDLSGKVIIQLSYELFGAGVEYSLDLSTLPYGIYYLKIGNSKFLSYEKIVKQ